MNIYSYAKVNMVLEILGKLNNQCHELTGIYQNIDMKDLITIEAANEDSVLVENIDIPQSKNLVYQVLNKFKKRYKIKESFEIIIKKNIPLSSGLGGGSSNAVAVIGGLQNILDLKIKKVEIAEFLSNFGSDLPFFTYGGTCLVEGAGEKIIKLNDTKNRFVYVYNPEIRIQNKTKIMFQELRSNNYSDGSYTNAARKIIQNNDHLRNSNFFNSFEKIALQKFNQLKIVQDEMKDLFGNSFLSGAGMTLISVSEKSIDNKKFNKYSTVNKGFDFDI